jgi:hypothetical protein
MNMIRLVLRRYSCLNGRPGLAEHFEKLNEESCVQLCLFGVCIPLDVIIPAMLGWLYFIGVDLLWFLPPSWKQQIQKRKDESPTQVKAETTSSSPGTGASTIVEDSRFAKEKQHRAALNSSEHTFDCS